MKQNTNQSSGRKQDLGLSTSTGFNRTESAFLEQVLTEHQLQIFRSIKKDDREKTPSHPTVDPLAFQVESAKKKMPRAYLQEFGKDRLYKCAIEQQNNSKRLVQMAYDHAKQCAREPKLSLGSYNLMAKRNVQKIESAIREVNPMEHSQLNFQQIGRLFTVLKIFKVVQYNQQLEVVPEAGLTEQGLKRKVKEWSLLQYFYSLAAVPEEAQPLTETVKLLLSVLTDPSADSVTHRAQNLVTVMAGYWQQFIDEQLERFFNVDRVIAVVTLFKQLIIQKLSQPKENYFKKRETEETDETRPKFNEAAVVRLFQYHKSKNEKLEQLRCEKSEQQTKECTFTPKVNRVKTEYRENVTDRLYKVDYVKKREERTRQAKELREKQEMEQCTFRPATSRVVSAGEQAKCLPGYQKAVDRLRRANKQNRAQKYRREYIPTGENYRGPGYKICAPKFQERVKTAKRLLFCVEVGMAGKVGKIEVGEGDDPERLASNFCRIYGLGSEVRKELEELIVEELLQNVSCQT